MQNISMQKKPTFKAEFLKEAFEKVKEYESELSDLEKQEISLGKELQIMTKISQGVDKLFEEHPNKDFMKQRASDELEETKYALLHLKEEINNLKIEIDYNQAKISIFKDPTFYIDK